MQLSERIHEELKASMKAQDELKRSVLRLLLSAMKTKEKEVNRSLTDNEVIKIVSNQIKQRKDSASQYQNANRADLAQREEEELKILETFMPRQLSGEELEKLVSQVVNEIGASTPEDLGKVMKAIMIRVGGRADGKVINQMVRSRLSSVS